MKKYKETKTIYPPQEVEVDIFETIDGRKFEIKEEAETHEKRLGITSLILVNSLPENLSIHYVNSLEEVKLLSASEIEDLEKLEGIQFPCWIGLNEIDYYGYGRDTYVYDLRFLEESMESTYSSYQMLMEKIKETL